MIKRFISSLAVLILITGVFSGMPVYARDGSSGGDSSNTIVANPPHTTEGTSESGQSTEIKNQASNLTDQFKEQARTSVEEKKTQVKAQTEEHRQKSCEARKANITKRMNNAVSQAEKHKAVFDKIYEKVKTFKTTKNVDVTNYDSLTAAVDQAQANAQANITALKNLDVSVDCSSTTVAQSLASFQAAVKSTHDSLKAYRESITKLIVAVKSSLPTSDKTSDSQSETKQ